MSAHLPGLWTVDEEAFDNDGYPETVIRGLGRAAAIAVAIDFGENNPLMREANARRIVTCVNACDGLPQDTLDGGWTAAGMIAYASKLERHNAELIEALQMIADQLERVGDARPHKDGQYIDAAREAITKATGA
jgi:hypothetical protein